MVTETTKAHQQQQQQRRQKTNNVTDKWVFIVPLRRTTYIVQIIHKWQSTHWRARAAVRSHIVSRSDLVSCK